MKNNKKLIAEFTELMRVFGAKNIGLYFDNCDNYIKQRSQKSLDEIISELVKNL